VSVHPGQRLFDFGQNDIFQRPGAPLCEAIVGHQSIQITGDARKPGGKLDQPVKGFPTLFGLARGKTRPRRHGRATNLLKPGLGQHHSHEIALLHL